MDGMTEPMRVGAPAGPMGLFAAVIVIAAALIVGRPAAAGEAGAAAAWRVGDIQGEARIRDAAGPWRALRRNDGIPSESEVETGGASRLRLDGPHGTITVLPNSRFGLRAAPGRPAGMPGIIQRTGSLQFRIATAPATPFRVDTPFMTATIAGASFTITVKQGNAALYVSEGAARVMSVLTGEAAVLQPRQLAWVNAPSGGWLKTMVIRPRAAAPANRLRRSPARAPRIGGKVLARLEIGRSAG